MVLLLLNLLFVADVTAKAPPPRRSRLCDNPKTEECALDGSSWVMRRSSSRTNCAGKFVGDWDREDQ